MRHVVKDRRTSGFTLVELLVVIAIIGVLVALLLPAVQAAREAARRTQCTNNLKQTGIAFQTHLDAKKHFPTAGTNVDDFWRTRAAIEAIPNFNEVSRFGWTFQILPYIEQANIYDAAKDNDPLAIIPGVGISLVEHSVPSYVCPSRGPRPVILADGTIIQLGDYAGVYFHIMGNQWRDGNYYDSPAGQTAQEFGWRGLVTKGGHYYRRSGSTRFYNVWDRVDAGSVSDGLSNTIAVMEKAVWTQRYELEGDLSGADFTYTEIPGWTVGAHQPTMRNISGDGGLAFTVPDGQTINRWSTGRGAGNNPPLADSANSVPDIERDPSRAAMPRGDVADDGFGSAHPSIMLAVFGDGSVRALSFDIDSRMGGTLFRLGCRDDGLILEGEEL